MSDETAHNIRAGLLVCHELMIGSVLVNGPRSQALVPLYSHMKCAFTPLCLPSLSKYLALSFILLP